MAGLNFALGSSAFLTAFGVTGSDVHSDGAESALVNGWFSDGLDGWDVEIGSPVIVVSGESRYLKGLGGDARISQEVAVPDGVGGLRVAFELLAYVNGNDYAEIWLRLRGSAEMRRDVLLIKSVPGDPNEWGRYVFAQPLPSWAEFAKLEILTVASSGANADGYVRRCGVWFE